MLHQLPTCILATCLITFACKSKPPAATQATNEAKVSGSAATDQASLSQPAALPPAKVGEAAPDFELSDLDGNQIKLSSFRGKIVVLEWFNPECPFVRASHTKGSLVDAAKRHAKASVVWLAVNSSAPGKQGHGVEKSREGQKRFNMEYPILLDPDGRVGKAYGAKRTPHMFVVDTQGVLAYRGAIDNSPDGERESPKDGKLENYVDSAIAALTANRPVSTKETEAYGCSVKYGS